MISGLVTIGTTTFDSLIKVLDKPSTDVSLTFQIAAGVYEPIHHTYKRFIPNLQSHYLSYDFIITHAGAGSVYSLLELPTKFAVVANTDRSDNHQLELSKFVQSNNYAKTYSVDAMKVLSLLQIFQGIERYNSVQYKKEKFFKGKEIIEFIQSEE
tara:strand:+ start:1692 stop:2156 length:465 start_codon:yes stop_codon:yes gene_type:complete